MVIGDGDSCLLLQVLDPELEVADHAFPPLSTQPSAPKIQVGKTQLRYEKRQEASLKFILRL